MASEFVFGLLGIRDGMDMHEFIETAGGNKNEIMNVGNKNTAESKSLDMEQKGEWCHRPWEKQRGREGNWNGK